MIALTNRDGTFFRVDIKSKLTGRFEVASKDIVSFSVTEENNYCITASVKLLDTNQTYAWLFRPGTKCSLSWGYTSPDLSFDQLTKTLDNPLEMRGSFARSGIQGFVKDPQGEANADGTCMFSCNIVCSSFNRKKTRRVYQSGTKGSVVREVFTRMQVPGAYIAFDDMIDIVSGAKGKQIVQTETDSAFLCRLARQWKCVYRIGYSPLGIKYGLFCDTSKLDKSPFSMITAGVIAGNSILLDWKEGCKNVLSYTWRMDSSQSGSGDQVRMVEVNGKYTAVRSVAEEGKIVDYKFNADKVKADMVGAQASAGLPGLAGYVAWAMDVGDFNELVRRGYFTAYQQRTAPQGGGFELKVKMIGNPLMTAPTRVELGKGFPPNLVSRAGLRYMYANKVTHTISRSGYEMELQLVNTYSPFGQFKNVGVAT